MRFALVYTRSSLRSIAFLGKRLRRGACTGKPDFYAPSVCIDATRRHNNLKGCVNDADGMAKVLKGQRGQAVRPYRRRRPDRRQGDFDCHACRHESS